jgi:hypothetical protein
VAVIEIDGAGRIAVDFQHAGDVLQGKAIENGGQPGPRLLA